MVAVQFDESREKLLNELARVEGPEDIARRVLEDYLDFQSLQKDDPSEWAKVAVQLTPEILAHENSGEE